jgi:hypothetical protein
MRYAEADITHELLVELEPLLKVNAEETGIGGEFCLNKLVYIRAASLGSYVGFTVRNDSGECVGYSGFAVNEHLYLPQYTMAQQDTLYLREDYRKGMTGIRLIKYSEKILRGKYRVNLILQNSTPERDLSNLFKRLGYSERDRVFVKTL